MIDYFPPPENFWFTADPHWDNFEINRHCRRPFFTDKQGKFDDHHRRVMERARKTIARNINSVVKPDDMLVLNGDLTFAGPQHRDLVEPYIRELNGRKIMVYGNHDRMRGPTYVGMGCVIATTALVVEKYGIVVVHDPTAANVDPDRKWLWLCGHVHLAWLFSKYNPETGLGHNCINVGLDVWNFYPVNLKTLFELADKEGLR